MAEEFFEELLEDVVTTAQALGPLAEDEMVVNLLVQSYRAQDHDTFHSLLERFDLTQRCGLICRWLASKHCTLVCMELCGPPPEDEVPLDLRRFGEILQKITANQGLLDRLAGAVIERDEAAFRAILEKLDLMPYCHYICTWICRIRADLICELLCRPDRPLYLIGCVHLVPVLQEAAAAVGRLLKAPRGLAEIEKAVLSRDCNAVRVAIERAGLQGVCRWICLWICVWRCVRVCIFICRVIPPEPIDREIPEIIDFARAVGKLADQPEVVRKLLTTFDSGDAKAFAEVVKELGLTRFCHQICFWLCRFWCYRFCICVCPPARPRPWFTHVGHFHIYGDIDNTSGLTNKSVLGHGGPNYGFFSCLELRGFCPAFSPDASAVPMQYRFLYDQGGTPTPMVGSLLCPVIVGSRTIYWDVNGTGLEETFQTVMVAGAGGTLDPTPPPAVPPGTPWGPPPTHVIVPDSNGWIRVDSDALGAGFNGALIGFNTNTPFPGGDSLPGVAAGAQIPNANLKAGVDLEITFEATRVGGPLSPPDYTNSLPKIHINNWDEAALLDLLQFHTAGGTPCSPLSTDLDIEYSADHELMASWRIDIITAAPGLPITNPLVNGTATRDASGSHTAFGTHHEDISSWPTCSYTVRLRTRRALTTGLDDASHRDVPKTFCIGSRNGRPIVTPRG